MAPIQQLLVRQALPSAAAQGWLWLTPISPQVASYSAPFVLVAIVVVYGLGYLFLKRGAVPARRAYAWDCGFGQLTHRMQYTSTAFSQPIRRVFGAVWKVEEHVETLASPGPIPRVTSLHYSLHTQTGRGCAATFRSDAWCSLRRIASASSRPATSTPT